MTTISIRRSGGANIISIPKAILKAVGLHVGSPLDVTIEDNKIVLSPSSEVICLDEILAQSPKSTLKRYQEDATWLNEKPKGHEVW